MILALAIMVFTFVSIFVLYMLMSNTTIGKRVSTSRTVKEVTAHIISKPLDVRAFNEKFVAGNQALSGGNTEALKKGISLFIESLDFAGEFTEDMLSIISELRCALSHHDRADTKGPWNRDLSGYGVSSWKRDLYSRDEALRSAWGPIERINEKLKSRGLGWNY